MRKSQTAGFLVCFFFILCAAAGASAQTWTPVPGAATDVGVSAKDAVWIIGIEPVAGGYSIYRWSGTAWEKVPGGAVRIAVAPDGTPWIVNDSNNIFRWDGSTWQRIPGSARDIAFGADGTVWSLDPNGTPQRWSGSAWIRTDGVATAIAVDAKGVPWIVNVAGEIYRRNAAGAGWERIPGTAKDIAIATDGTPYIIGSKPAPGGFHVQRRVGADWQEEPQTGVRVAAGSAAVVYVVQDTAAKQGIRSRGAGMITLTGPAIDITSKPAAETPKSDPPLVVQGYAGAAAQQGLVRGSLVCPIIEAGPKLVKGCSFVGEPAVFLGKAPSTTCPAGSFHDPQNGGECWSCPDGYTRNASPVGSADACWKAVSEDLKTATRVGTTGCPGGTFSDPRNGGECWSCPAGYMRTLAPVTAGDACAKDLVLGPKSAAKFHQRSGSCADGTFFDPIHGGTCWTCPADYRRTANHIESTGACAKTIPTQYAGATQVSGCSMFTSSVGFGTAFRDPRGGGECWACPVQLKRSAAPVSTTKTGNGAACVVGADTEGIVWQSPQYPEPGMYSFLEGLVDVAFQDPKRVDAFVQLRANGDPQKRREIWQKMRSAPHDSPEFKALTFAALLTLANQRDNPKGWSAVNSFADYIRNRRIFVAQEATAMYSAWQDLNAYNQWQAARRASGIGGMDPAVLGATPGDYQSVAWIAASPDQRGGEFVEALTALGVLSSKLALASPGSGGGWNAAYLLPVYKALEKAIDKYADWALDTVSWGKISGKTFQAAGRAAGLALIAFQSAVDLSTAITTIVGQEEANKVYANLVTEAQAKVDIPAMVNSKDEADAHQLVLFWALATSPYKAGPKAGEGQLSDQAICADAAVRSRCQAVNAVVTAAGTAVNAWGPTTAPAPVAVSGFHEEARVVSIDAATSTVRARMTEMARIVVVRLPDPAPLKTLKVGSILYLDLNRRMASLDGKVACCSFVVQGSQQP